MIQETIYRGKRVDNESWVFGVLFYKKNEDKYYIINKARQQDKTKKFRFFKGVEVIKETIIKEEH